MESFPGNKQSLGTSRFLLAAHFSVTMESESSDSDPMDVGIGGEEEGYKSFEEEEGVEEYKSFESSSGEGSVQADRTTGGETASSLEEQQLPPQGSEVVEEARHGLDLARTAEEYAQYLVVNSKQDVSWKLHCVSLVSCIDNLHRCTLLLSSCRLELLPPLHLKKQALDERIENVVFRVEEFKRQLEWMHQNITSCSGKTHELYEHTQQLKELFRRIDQVEVSLEGGPIRVCLPCCSQSV